MVLERGQIPNCRGVRVHVSTGYNRVKENRRWLRNGRVSDPPEILTIRIGLVGIFSTIASRVEGNTYVANVWDVSIV
jgi:hypothetical protein